MVLSTDAFIYTTGGDGKIQSGGYSINSLFQAAGIPAVTAINGGQTGGSGKASDRLFNSLIIPSGVTLMRKAVQGITSVPSYTIKKIDDGADFIKDEVYDKIVDAVETGVKRATKGGSPINPNSVNDPDEEGFIIGAHKKRNTRRRRARRSGTRRR